jgi:hypothetical protein
MKKLYKITFPDEKHYDLGFADNIIQALSKFCEAVGYKTIRILEEYPEHLVALLSDDDIEDELTYIVTIKQLETLF